MSKQSDGDKSNGRNGALNRRKMLLGGTTLAAASALSTAAAIQSAQA